MFNFFLGVLITLALVIILLKFVFKEYYQSLEEARQIYHDLTQLYDKCQEISENMVRDLEEQITQGKDILKSLEEKVNYTPGKAKRTKNNKTSPKTQIQPPAFSPKQKAILELADQGFSIKEIAQNLGVEQDRVAMVLQLYKDSH